MQPASPMRVQEVLHRRPGKRAARRSAAVPAWRRIRVFLAALALAAAGAPSATAQLKQTFYVPIAEEGVRATSIAVNTTNGGNTTAPNPSTNRAVVSLTSTANGTVVYYDHWEDGYEADLSNPVQGTTETFNLDAGDFTALENDVFANPRDPLEIRYDGRDKIGSTEPIAVTRAGWRLQEGTLLAGAVEVFPTIDWGSRYVFPVGEDVGSNQMFQHAAASVMAGDRGAVISLDTDNDGFDDLTQSLAAGEAAYLDGILTGSFLRSTDPVQVHLLTGDVGSTYESRWFAMVPFTAWGASYYTPVDSASSADTVVLLFNPSASAITVTHETRGTGVGSTETVEDTNSTALNENVAPCNNPILRTFSITGSGTVAGVRLGFNADHTYRGDIELTLESPTGTRVDLVTNSGGDANDNFDILLDDTSANPIDDNIDDNTATPFYDRTVAPENAFSAFDGENANGTWTLEICDFYNQDSGTYNRSQLEVDFAAVGSTVVQGNVNVPAGGLTEFLMPEDSAARFFTTGDEPFFAISTIDYNGQNHDWGHPLLPEDALSSVLVAGWAPGRDPTSGTNPSENGSPLWVTATGATTIYIDFDGDPTTGALTDPAGNQYDEDRTLAELETTKIFDTGDGDQSGARVYTLDGTLLTAAWGQDPDTASAAAPGLDLGTVVLPLESLRASKEGTLYDDADGDGGVDPGDLLQFTIRVENVSDAVVTNITVEDFGLDANLTYVADSTEVGGVTIADDMAPSTAFPLDEGGYLLGTLGVGETVFITFLVEVNDPLPPGVDDLANQVRVTTTSQIETSSSITPVGNPKLSITKTSDATGDLLPGQTVNYTITVSNSDNAPATSIRVLDQLPAGTTYQSQSTVANGFEVTSGTFPFDNTTSGSVSEAATPCSSPLVRTFNVGTSVTITRVSLGFNISHSFRGDLQVTLESPDGTRVVVIEDDSGDGDNNLDVLIQDGSGNPLDDGTPDSTGTPFYDRTVAPANSLSAFDGEDSAGTWTLEVCDVFAADNGTFNRAQLQIVGSSSSAVTKSNAAAAPDPLQDGVPTDLVLAPDGLALLPSQSMTVTYTVTVDDPLDASVTSVINTAVVTSLEQSEPLRATVIDPLSLLGTIGDRLWLDVDGDGVQDVGEPGLAGVTVEIYDAGGDGVPGGGDDVLVQTLITGANGGYLATRLPPGTYFVDVDGATLPAGLALSPGSSDPTATRTITAEEIFLDLDIGYTTADPATAIIGDYVWSDADGDGLQDPGEAGLGGVTVELLDAGGAVVATTTTDAAGRYRFTGVAAGEYQVRIAASNFSGGQPLDGFSATTGPQSQGGTLSAPVLVAAGDIELQVDFGFDGTTFSIDDAVWVDLDADGVFDPSEPPLENVTVDLLDDSGNVVGTTRTAADGSFSFTGLPPGDYTLQVSDHSGRLRGLGGTTTDARARQLAVTITAADISNETFGYNGPATLGDRVWSDVDGDGVQDAGEVGLAGVTVELLDRDGLVIDTAVTDALGYYLFEAILPESYSVRVDATSLPAGFTQTGDPDGSFDDQSSTLLALGESDRSLDFGYQNSARPDISGNVFEDLDRDGADDGAGEPGFAGVTLELRDTSGNVLARALTDANGDYSFDDLPAGDYVVAVTDQAGVLADTVLTSGLDQIPVTVVASDITGIDFGYARRGALGSIGDLVWLDADGDGERDGAENGISGVTVELYDPGPDGVIGGGDDVLVAATVTDSSGLYRFEGLDAGTYFAQVSTATLPGGGTDLVATTANPSALILLSDGERYSDADFGFGSAGGVGLIGDFVWFDGDGDGDQDPGEIGLGGITVRLFGPGCSPCTTVTAADGSYYFPGLPAGDYAVFLDPSSVPAAYDPNPTNTDEEWEITLSAGEAVSSADFGLPAAGAVGTIGDLVWLDSDADGMQDAGEPGLEGVTIVLTDTSGNVLADTTTAADGSYSFTGLEAGSYRVRVTDLDGVLSGLELVSGSSPTATIVLGAGATFQDADFGYDAAGGRGTIGDLVWHDLDADGSRDSGEPGLGGITVALWQDADGDGVIDPGLDNLVRTAVTDTTGRYEFTGLPDGDYIVDLTDTTGALTDLVKTSGSAGVDNESQSDPYAVTLSGGVANTTADFGYEAPDDLSIAGTAFFDLDGDGTQDAVDAGVEVVRAFLFRDLDGDGVLDPEDAYFGSQLTAPNGDYLFTDLPPGDFIVAVDATGTFVDGAVQTTQLLTDLVQPVTLVATDSTENDFGFIRAATLALVTDVRLEEHGGELWLAFSTASEAGTVGFHVWRRGLAGPEKVGTVFSPLGAPQGADYRLALGTLDGAANYVIEEIAREGRHWLYGPFRLDPDRLEPTETEKIGSLSAAVAFDPAQITDGAWSAPRRPSGHAAERLERARLARESAEAARRAARSAADKAPAERIKLLVTSDGLQFAAAAELAAAFGVDEATLSNQLTRGELALRRADEPVAHWLGSSGADAGLFFHGLAKRDLYADHDIYWLEAGTALAPASVTAGPASPDPGGTFTATEHVEEDAFAATFVARDPALDYWHWRGLIAEHPDFGETTFELELPSVDTGASASLTVHLRGAGASDVVLEHHAEIEVGGRLVGEAYFDDLLDHNATFELLPGDLASTGATVIVRALLDTGAAQSFFYVDSFEVEYQRLLEAEDDALGGMWPNESTLSVSGFTAADLEVLDTSDADAPVRQTDALIEPDGADYRVSFAKPAGADRFLVASRAAAHRPLMITDTASSLRAAENAARYLVITTPDMLTAAERLRTRREADFGSAMVVLLEDVYDEFAAGRPLPEAVGDLLTWAHENWAESPSHVALLGRGHFDYRGRLGGLPAVPPQLIATPFGLYSSDSALGDVDGDGKPEIAVGRIPAADAAEADAYIDKIELYESQAEAWSSRVLLVADNADNGGDFEKDVDRVAASLPAGLDVETLELADGAGVTRDELFARLQEGAGWSAWVGHGGVDRLADEGLLVSGDAPSIQNEERPTLLTAFSCSIARFELPDFTSLAEELVMAPGGAVAAWAPSGQTLHPDSQRAFELLAESAYSGENATLGDLILQVKESYAKVVLLPTDLAVYQLLGDPGLVLQLPPLGGLQTIFADGFETGDTSRWSAAESESSLGGEPPGN